MTAIDGTNERLIGVPIRRRHTLLSVLPSIALHGAIAAAVWLGFAQRPGEIKPPVTFISLAPAPESAPPEPLPPTGIRLPQPEPETAPEPPLDFAPPPLPKAESFPFDPSATREAPPPEPEAVPIEKAEEKPKPPPEKPKDVTVKAKPKPVAKPKPKAELVKRAKPDPTPAPPAAETKAAQNPAPTVAKPATAMPVNAKQNAAISNAPVRVTNPNYAGACPISYPERARRRNQEGTVVIHALIGPDGKPIEVTVAQSSGHSLLDKAAQEAISHCAFVPQQVGGRGVKAIVEIPIPFRLI